jgi:putative iron-dependent peroxidase
VGQGEYGTYFIGYARTPARTELMLQNMFIGRPEGNYDRLLDVSRAVTGGLFFVPSVPLLESLADDDPADAADAADPADATAAPGAAANGQHEPESAARSGSLNIGRLRGVSHDG